MNDGFLFSWGDASARRYFSRWKTSPVTCWGSAAQVVGVLHLMVFFQKKKKRLRMTPGLLARCCQAGGVQQLIMLRLPCFFKLVWKQIGCDFQPVVDTRWKRDG